MPGPGWVYRALLWLTTPLLVGYTLWRSARDGGRRYARQRLGLELPAAHPGLWLHAASVGEILTAAPLIQACLEARPHASLFVTTNTPTGRRVLLERFADVVASQRLAHAYLPIDWPLAQRRFVRALRPAALLVVETEIWPALYTRCRRESIALTIINGRLSQRSLRLADSILGPAMQRALSDVHVLARSATDARRYQALGAGNVEIMGDLKFADTRPAEPAARPIPTPYWLVASTHDDEEMQLAGAWLEQAPEGLLVIAPRHPERGIELQSRLARLPRLQAHPHWLCATRSQNASPENSHRVYLADTLGELQAWYAHAEAVFVGGSLIPHGGHNLLEPARLGRSIVTGPYTGNFEHVVTHLLAADALVIAGSAREAIAALLESVENPRAVQARGQRAQASALAAARVLDDYLERVLALDAATSACQPGSSSG